jgi:hypothetical protein
VKKNNRNTILGLLTAIMLSVFTTNAFATFIGTTLEVTGRDPNLSTVSVSESFLIDSNIEILFKGLSGFSEHIIDITENQIIFTSGFSGLFRNNEFNGFVFSDSIGNIFDFISVSINQASSYAGFLASGHVSFDTNNIYVSFSGVAAQEGDMLILDINKVSAPSMFALLSLVMLGFLARNKYK